MKREYENLITRTLSLVMFSRAPSEGDWNVPNKHHRFQFHISLVFSLDKFSPLCLLFVFSNGKYLSKHKDHAINTPLCVFLNFQGLQGVLGIRPRYTYTRGFYIEYRNDSTSVKEAN